MIIDSHCHLEYEPMVSNLKEVVDRALKNDVKYLLSISTTDESYDKILKIVDTYKNIYGTYGIHPHETKNYVSLSSNQIVKKTQLNKKNNWYWRNGFRFLLRLFGSTSAKKTIHRAYNSCSNIKFTFNSAH